MKKTLSLLLALVMVFALSANGYDMSKVFTLEGGFNNWSEAQPDHVEP